MREFDGKVAVVTGAASGMGLAFAQRFAREGMKVVLADYEAERLEEAATGMRQSEFDVEAVVADVSTQDALDDLAARTYDTYGACHVLCNNAGVVADSDVGVLLATGKEQAIWEQPLDDWHWTFNVNFWGVVHGIRAFVPRMIAQGEEGHIVNTASIAGLTGGAGLPIYGATKHGVVRISESLYLQLQAAGAPIGVSVLCPGGVRTRIAFAERNRPDDLAGAGVLSANELAEREATWAQRTQEGGLDPDEVAEMVFDAVRDEQFWILTHPELDAAVKMRSDGILERRNPAQAQF